MEYIANPSKVCLFATENPLPFGRTCNTGNHEAPWWLPYNISSVYVTSVKLKHINHVPRVWVCVSRWWQTNARFAGGELNDRVEPAAIRAKFSIPSYISPVGDRKEKIYFNHSWWTWINTNKVIRAVQSSVCQSGSNMYTWQSLTFQVSEDRRFAQNCRGSLEYSNSGK